MNSKISKQYISEVKTLFPLIGKSERNYIKKLKTNVESCCDENNITTKQELYDCYGLPNDVVNDYYSSVDTEYLIRKIRISKYLKMIVAIVLTVAVFATSIYCVKLYKGYQSYNRVQQQIENVEDIIGKMK